MKKCKFEQGVNHRSTSSALINKPKVLSRRFEFLEFLANDYPINIKYRVIVVSIFSIVGLISAGSVATAQVRSNTTPQSLTSEEALKVLEQNRYWEREFLEGNDQSLLPKIIQQSPSQSASQSASSLIFESPSFQLNQRAASLKSSSAPQKPQAGNALQIEQSQQNLQTSQNLGAALPIATINEEQINVAELAKRASQYRTTSGSQLTVGESNQAQTSSGESLSRLQINQEVQVDKNSQTAKLIQQQVGAISSSPQNYVENEIRADPDNQITISPSSQEKINSGESLSRLQTIQDVQVEQNSQTAKLIQRQIGEVSSSPQNYVERNEVSNNVGLSNTGSAIKNDNRNFWLEYSPSGNLLALPQAASARIVDINKGVEVDSSNVSAVDLTWYNRQVAGLGALQQTLANVARRANENTTNQQNITMPQVTARSPTIQAGNGVEVFPMNPDAAVSFANQGEFTSVVSVQAVGQPLTGHQSVVYSLAVYPDATKIVSGGGDGLVRVWDIATNRQIGLPLEGHRGLVYTVAVSPDGYRLASAGNDSGIILWDARTGSMVLPPLFGHRGEIYSIKFSADSRQLYSAGADGLINIWDVVSGVHLGNLAFHQSPIYSLAVSADGKYLASAGADQKIIIWNIKTREIIQELSGYSGNVYGLAFNPQADLLASVGSSSQVFIWSVQSGEPVGEPFNADGNALFSVNFGKKGLQLAAGSYDGKIWLWDVLTGKANAANPITGHNGWVGALSYDPSGEHLVSGSADGEIRMWRAPDSKIQIMDFANLRNITSTKIDTQISATPDATTPIAGVRTFDSVGGNSNLDKQRLIESLLDNSAISARSNDGGSWTVVTNRGIEQFSTIDNQPQKSMQIPNVLSQANWSAIAYSLNNNLIIAGDGNGRFVVFDAKDGKANSYLPYGNNKISRVVAISPSGYYTAVANNEGEIRVYKNLNINNANPLPADQTWLPAYSFSAHRGKVLSLAFANDYLLLSGGEDEKLQIYNVVDGKSLGEGYSGQKNPIVSIAIAKNGQEVATGGLDGSVHRWFINTAEDTTQKKQITGVVNTPDKINPNQVINQQQIQQQTQPQIQVQNQQNQAATQFDNVPQSTATAVPTQSSTQVPTTSDSRFSEINPADFSSRMPNSDRFVLPPEILTIPTQ